jgi:hypothetical protein
MQVVQGTMTSLLESSKRLLLLGRRTGLRGDRPR